MADQSLAEILDKLLERRDKISKEISALDSLISIYRGLVTQAVSESNEEEGQFNLRLQRSSRAVQAAGIARSIDAARRIIIAENRPMKRGELVKRLEAEGFSLPGEDKNKVFGTNIWRSGKFRAVANRGYWPKDISLPKT